jgi:hypothetical protein
MKEVVRHPYAYTLSLLRLALDKAPPTYPADYKQKYAERLAKFEDNPKTPYKEITDTIVQFGEDSWPWRKAYEEFYDRYGRSSEEAHLLERLDEGLRQKYEKFIHEGGKINYLEQPRSEEELYQPSPFEQYFTPEEKYAIQQALLDAREAAREEINELVTKSRAEDYTAAVEAWGKRQDSIVADIGELRQLAKVSDKWRAEILSRVRRLEEGWSVVEQGFDEEAVDKELEYWKGTLEAFLNA